MAGGQDVPTVGQTTLSGSQEVGSRPTLPVNVYETTGGMMIVAPMPGIEPEDIRITVTDDSLVMLGKQRGPRQEDKKYIQHEWHYGPYSRTLQLPMSVNAEQANATFGNGVLTISLLRASEMKPGPITLRHSGQARGQATGHSGQTARV